MGSRDFGSYTPMSIRRLNQCIIVMVMWSAVRVTTFMSTQSLGNHHGPVIHISLRFGKLKYSYILGGEKGSSGLEAGTLLCLNGMEAYGC